MIFLFKGVSRWVSLCNRVILSCYVFNKMLKNGMFLVYKFKKGKVVFLEIKRVVFEVFDK